MFKKFNIIYLNINLFILLKQIYFTNKIKKISIYSYFKKNIIVLTNYKHCI